MIILCGKMKDEYFSGLVALLTFSLIGSNQPRKFKHLCEIHILEAYCVFLRIIKVIINHNNISLRNVVV